MEKNVILCRLLIKERSFFKKNQDGFLKDNVIHIPCVSELQCLVELGGNFFFPLLIPGRKHSHKHISVPQTVRDRHFSVDSPAVKWKGTAFNLSTEQENLKYGSTAIYANPS